MGLFRRDASKLKAKGDIARLSRASRSTNTNESWDAIDALGDLGAAEPLIEHLARLVTVRTSGLGKQSAEWQATADATVGRIEQALERTGAAAVPQLIAVLQTRAQMPVALQRSALRVLSALRDLRAAPVLLEMLGERVEWEHGGRQALLVEAIAAMGEPVIPFLVKNITRFEAEALLPRFGDAAAAAVAPLAERPGAERTPATRVLVRLGDPRGFAFLLSEVKGGRARPQDLKQMMNMMKGLGDRLRHPDPAVRAAAADALRQLGELKAIESLRQRLRATMVKPLSDALTDGSEPVRAAAESALEAIGGDQAQRALARHRRAENP